MFLSEPQNVLFILNDAVTYNRYLCLPIQFNHFVRTCVCVVAFIFAIVLNTIDDVVVGAAAAIFVEMSVDS